jgi:hypothetical protein
MTLEVLRLETYSSAHQACTSGSSDNISVPHLDCCSHQWVYTGMDTLKPGAGFPPIVLAEFFDRVVHPRGALQSLADGTFDLTVAAGEYRAEILKRPDAERALHMVEGIVVGIRHTLRVQRAKAGQGPSAKGERTRTRVIDAWQSTHAVVTNETGKMPQRKAMVGLVADQLGLSEWTVEKYAPRR